MEINTILFWSVATEQRNSVDQPHTKIEHYKFKSL